jgi:glycerol kinase
MSRETYILALDQGTTSSRSIVFDRKGKIISTAQKEFEQHYPQPGWVEHDPLEIWSSQSATAAEALSRADLTADDIAAVGITNQRETTILWDKKTGRPVYKAIVWQDRRTADYCGQLKRDGVEAMVTEKTGLRIDPYFAGTKLRWILENVDGVRRRAEDGDLIFGTVDCWIAWQLSGRKVHVTDTSNAARTLLYNVNTHEWDEELLELFGIPRQLLPEVKASSEVVGEVGPKQSPAGVPIAGMAGDQHAALFGQTCFSPGMAKSTYGTGSFLLMNMGTERVKSENNLLSTVAWKIGDTVEYALEGSVFIAGAAVQWIRDELQLVRSAKELDRLASTVEDTGGLYLVPAFAGLGAPHWDPYARGAALGMTRGTNRAHFCRAALESIAYQTADLITAMEKDSGITLKELRVDGGASNSKPLLQFQSDLLQEKVVRPKCVETTALGAAYLAGLAVGYWESRDEIRENWGIDLTFTPERDAEEMKALQRGWDKAVERSKSWIEPDS